MGVGREKCNHTYQLSKVVNPLSQEPGQSQRERSLLLLRFCGIEAVSIGGRLHTNGEIIVSGEPRWASPGRSLMSTQPR